MKKHLLVIASMIFFTACSSTQEQTVKLKNDRPQQRFITRSGQHTFVLAKVPKDPSSIVVLVSNDVINTQNYELDCDQLVRGCNTEISQSWKYNPQENMVRFNYKLPKNKLVIIKFD